MQGIIKQNFIFKNATLGQFAHIPLNLDIHYSDVIMGAMACQITVVPIVYSTVCSDTDKKNPSKLRVTGLVRGIHRWPVNSPHKRPVTRKMLMRSSYSYHRYPPGVMYNVTRHALQPKKCIIEWIVYVKPGCILYRWAVCISSNLQLKLLKSIIMRTKSGMFC